MAPNADITFERLAVTPEQINRLGFADTSHQEDRNSRAKGFGDISVELDAIEPDLLRAIVLDAIEDHLPERSSSRC